MTKEQKQAIINMRKQGLPFSHIAEAVGVCRSTVKSWHRREIIRRAEEEQRKREKCQFCGKRLTQRPKQKRRHYCDDACRYAYWNQHRTDPGRKGTCIYTCNYCGKEFVGVPSTIRKYCSTPCYTNARYGAVPTTECKEKVRLTKEQKQAIVDMREQGLPFSQISETLGIADGTARSSHRREMQKREVAREREEKNRMKHHFCLNCGKELQQSSNSKRLYCGEKCSREYRYRNNAAKYKNPNCIPCAYCRKAFDTEGRNRRKYCSRECFYKARYYGEVSV